MKKLVNLSLSKSALILSKGLIVLLVLLAFSCSTRKAETHKKEESVSVIEQKDIQKTETEKIHADILKIKLRQDINISPRDPEKEMQVIYGNDTIVATNADINISTRKDSEKDKSQTTRQSSKTDNSITSRETENKEKDRTTERQSASWGLNLGIIFGVIVLIIVGYVHFRTR